LRRAAHPVTCVLDLLLSLPEEQYGLMVVPNAATTAIRYCGLADSSGHIRARATSDHETSTTNAHST